MEQHTQAILLRRTPWSETSLIVTWLTASHGLLKTSARGARKPRGPFAGKLDFLYQAEISVALSLHGDLHSLREVGEVRPFDAARVQGAGFFLAAYFAELSGLAAPSHHPAPEIFDLLRRALAYLQQARADERALHHFERELCRILGIHDASGRVTPAAAIASLSGGLPRSRAAALKFFSPQGPGAV